MSIISLDTMFSALLLTAVVYFLFSNSLLGRTIASAIICAGLVGRCITAPFVERPRWIFWLDLVASILYAIIFASNLKTYRRLKTK